MDDTNLSRRVLAEALATALLLAAVVGSGIMGDRLAGGNVAVALLANTLATAAALVALILTFGPVCGAHMNPAVTLALAMRGQFAWRHVAPQIAAQIVGAVAGVWLAHLMFDLPILQASTTARTGIGQWAGEATATAGLVLVILAGLRHRPDSIPWAVACWITAAYWFTSSTSFANPAVTLARGLSDTFAGIRPTDVPAFVVVQLVAAVAASVLGGRLYDVTPAAAGTSLETRPSTAIGHGVSG